MSNNVRHNSPNEGSNEPLDRAEDATTNRARNLANENLELITDFLGPRQRPDQLVNYRPNVQVEDSPSASMEMPIVEANRSYEEPTTE